MAARKPNLLWAERSDKLFLTIDVQDAGASKPLVKVEEATSGNGRVIFKCVSSICTAVKSRSSRSHCWGAKHAKRLEQPPALRESAMARRCAWIGPIIPLATAGVRLPRVKEGAI